MVDIKAIKAEILETAGRSKPPQSFVDQNDMFDMGIREYFNPASRAPQAMTLNMLQCAASMCKGGADITEAEIKAILDRHAPKP